MKNYQHSLRMGVAACAVAFTTLSFAAPAFAQRAISLPSASLEDAIHALSRTAQVEILADPALLRGIRAPAVRGVGSPERALAKMLEGSGLDYRKRGNAYVIVQRARVTEATPARGNEARPAASPPAADEAVADEVAPEPAQDIVVTGSRIARPELESPMPVSVTTMDFANSMGLTTVYDALRLDPAIDIGIGSGNAQGQSWDAGVASVDLRGLGVNRTLTLLDGRRRVSGSARSSAVDLNMIPQAMIDHVEVVTGGAAAIYGADAVTGAVNIVTRTDFSGIQFDATGGISEHGDAERFKFSVTTGGHFAEGRGRILLGGTYVNNAELIYQDRPYTAGGHSYYDNPDNTGPDDGRPDLLWTDNYQWVAYSPYSNFLIGRQKTPYMISNGELVMVTVDEVNGTRGKDFPQGLGGNSEGNLFRGHQLQGPLKTYGVMGKLDYEIAGGINYSANFDYTSSKYMGSAGWYRDDQRSNLWLKGKGGATAYIDNPYMPAAMRELMVANGVTEVAIRKWWTNFPDMREIHDRENFTLSQGLNGDFAAGRFTWDAYWQYGRTSDRVRTTNAPFIPHWTAARDAISLDGTIVCRDPAARADGCVPFDIFGQTTTAEQQAYATTTRQEYRRNTQELFGASISGPAFALPYGDVSIALGAEHREEGLKTVDDPRTATGLQFTVHPDIDASLKVSEIFGEIVIPVLAGLPYAETLQLEGAYRYSNYNVYDDTHTWKAGAIWSPFDGLAFRAVRSFSVRTPNFGELYSPQNRSVTASIHDPCFGDLYNLNSNRAKNCAALGIAEGQDQYWDTVVVFSGGNPDLKPEESNSLTLGAIIQPAFLPGFDLTVDYWAIDIENVVTSYSVSNMENKCVDLPSLDNSFCPNITRDPLTGKITQINTFSINASRMKARGVDLGISYSRPLGRGNLAAAFKGTWNIENIIDSTPGIDSGILHYDGDFTTPRFRANLYTAYSLDDFTIALNNQFISAAVVSQNWASPEYLGDKNKVQAKVYTNLSLRHNFDDRFTLGLGVNNLFDVKPTDTRNVWDGGGGRYDTIGRYYFATVSAKL